MGDVSTDGTVRIMKDLVGRLKTLRVLRRKSRSLWRFLDPLRVELPKLSPDSEINYELELLTFQLKRAVEKLMDRRESHLGSIIIFFFEARRQVDSLDDIEMKLRTQVQRCRDRGNNSLAEEVEEIRNEVEKRQSRENEQDLDQDLRRLKQTLQERIEGGASFAPEAERMLEVLEGVSLRDLDGELRSPRSAVARAASKLTAAVSDFLRKESATLPADQLVIDTENPLGQGAFGHVYRATLGGKPVAVKRCTQSGNTEDLARLQDELLREAETWGLLRHKNVVGLLGVAYIDQKVHLVMEECDTSLDRVLHEDVDTPLTRDHMLTIMKGICRAMNYLHEQNVLHRDIKPANILLSHSLKGCVKLADFGLALLKGTDMTVFKAQAVEGSYPYLAPESMTSPIEYSRRSDIFAMAVTFWEIVERIKPWRNRGIGDIIKAVQFDARRLPFSKDAPWEGMEQVKTLVKRAWAQDPQARISGGRALAILSWRVHNRRSTRVMQNMLELFKVRGRSGGSADAGAAQASAAGRKPILLATTRRASFSRAARNFPQDARRGDLVRVKESVGTPRYGWQGASKKSRGNIVDILGAVFVVDFEDSDIAFQGLPTEFELVKEEDDAKQQRRDAAAGAVSASFDGRPKEGDFVKLAEGATEEPGTGVLSEGTKMGLIVLDDHSQVPFKIKSVDTNGNPTGRGVWYEEHVVQRVDPPTMKRGGLRVGMVVKMKEGVSEGCLARGSGFGIITVSDGSQIGFKVALLDATGDLTDETYWYSDAQLQVSSMDELKNTELLKEGDLVELAADVPFGVLELGQTGIVVQRDDDPVPLRVRRVNDRGEQEGGTWFYTDAQLVRARGVSALDREKQQQLLRDRPTAGDFVKLKKGYTGGCLRDSTRTGVIAEDDKSSVPFRVILLNAEGEMMEEHSWWYAASRLEKAPAPTPRQAPETGAPMAFSHNRPHARLRLGMRVRHPHAGTGNLVGWKYAGKREGDTSGGLRSDGYVRIDFDNGLVWNVDGHLAELLDVSS